jgi:hypothetical protein
MLFADNIEENFVYCIQSSQTNFMGFLLQPMNYTLSLLTSISGNITQSLDFVRTMISTIRDFITNIVSQIFGVFLNIVIEFQKIIIGMNDLIGKVVGIMTAIIYIIESVFLTMSSAWNGPPGQMVQALCFHPETKLKLKDGKIVVMDDIKIGNILCNGSKVIGTMKLLKRNKDQLFMIQSCHQAIYVTGEHHIFCNKTGEYIMVRDYYQAIQIPNCCPYYCSLLTDNHKIPIDEYMFWDYDDDLLRNSA